MHKQAVAKRLPIRTINFDDPEDTVRHDKWRWWSTRWRWTANWPPPPPPPTWSALAGKKVKAPVLIIQGRNDTRTPARPIELFEEKMKSLDKSIEVHWFDAGHLGSFAQVEQSIEHQELMLHFAYRILS